MRISVAKWAARLMVVWMALVVGTIGMAMAAQAKTPSARLLWGFEVKGPAGDGAIDGWLAKDDHTQISLVSDPAQVSQGTGSLGIRVASAGPGTRGWVQVLVQQDKDWSSFRTLTLDVYNPNPGATQMLVAVQVKNWVWNECPPVSLSAGWNRDVAIPLAQPVWQASEVPMGHTLDCTEVNGINLIFLPQEAGTYQFIVDNVRLDAAEPGQPAGGGPVSQDAAVPNWPYRVVDTMKTSRDQARMIVTEYDQIMIRAELQAIKSLGANYVAIDTPYNDEFLPFLTLWVKEARAVGLHVWFRGNWCEWEGWFGYPRSMTTYQQHIDATKQFILKHPDLFADGDSFTGCPEPENSPVLGDPRYNGRAAEFLQFIRDSYDAYNAAFAAIGRKVITNWFSVNGDIASQILDVRTVDHIGGLVTIDHYVASPAKMVQYVDQIHQRLGARVFLGEFGAPLRGLNDVQWTDTQQAAFIDRVMKVLAERPWVIGMSYWYGVDPRFFDPIRLFDLADNGLDLVRRPAADTVAGYFAQAARACGDGGLTQTPSDGGSAASACDQQGS